MNILKCLEIVCYKDVFNVPLKIKTVKKLETEVIMKLFGYSKYEIVAEHDDSKYIAYSKELIQIGNFYKWAKIGNVLILKTQ